MSPDTASPPLSPASSRRSSNSSLPPSKDVRVKNELLEHTKHQRKMIYDKIRDSSRTYMLDDPDMPVFVKNGIAAAFDNVWGDIEHECERNLRHALLATKSGDVDDTGPSGKGLVGLWCVFRSFVLSHYLPHNKSIYGKLKDPVYIIITVLTLIPLHGLRGLVFVIILCMLCFPGLPDQFQLVNFIILFKGMQFLTSGLIAMSVATIEYYACFTWHKDHLVDCMETRGPSGTESVGQILDYLSNILLVWVAFYMLHRHHSHARDVERCETSNSHDKLHASKKRLKAMMRYDIACFMISLSMLVILNCISGGFSSQIQLRANIYWSCVVYSLLSLPFSFFLSPGFQTLLIHHDPTGFDERGACVNFKLESSLQDQQIQLFSDTQKVAMMGVVNRIYKYAAVGSEMRGSRSTQGESQYSFGDIARGMWEKDVTRPALKVMGQLRGGGRTQDSKEGMHPLAIATVAIPAAEIRQLPDPSNAKHMIAKYRVNISLRDAKGEEASWFVYHRYRDFQELYAKLGSPDYAEAPFPSSHYRHADKIEIRRQGLEYWLEALVHDSRSQTAPWIAELNRFFDRKHGIIDELSRRSHVDSEPHDIGHSDRSLASSSGLWNSSPVIPSASEVKPLQIVVVSLPAEGIEQRERKTFFRVNVSARMEDLDVKKWHVERKYNDFEFLMKRLGLNENTYPDAPFPRKRTVNLLASRSDFDETRRQQLEIWIQFVVRDPMAKRFPQAGHIREFFDARCWRALEQQQIGLVDDGW